MVQKLEAIKGGGGSIKVGTTGTISSLMTRELDTIKSAPQTPVSFRHKPQTIPISVACGSVTPKKLQQRKSFDHGASTSGSGSSNSNIMKYESTHQTAQKVKSIHKNIHQVPMLGSNNNIALERTASRQKNDKKVVSNIVEVVDIKCGNPDKAWANPITNRLKKLGGFSKLSDSVV